MLLLLHQKEVVRRRTEFDLKHAKARYHIVEGLIKCLSILDDVIRVIRESKNKSDAKDNLVKEFLSLRWNKLRPLLLYNFIV